MESKVESTSPRADESVRRQVWLWAWIGAIPMAATLAICLFVIAPAWVGSRPPAVRTDLFLHGTAIYCKPKPLEQFRLLLAIFAVPLAAWAWAIGVSRWANNSSAKPGDSYGFHLKRGRRKPSAAWRWHSMGRENQLVSVSMGISTIERFDQAFGAGRFKVLSAAVMAVQLIIVAFAAWMWFEQESNVYHFFGWTDLLLGLTTIGIASVGFWSAKRFFGITLFPVAAKTSAPTAARGRGGWIVAAICIVAAAAYVVDRMSPAFYFSSEIPLGNRTMQEHLASTSGEFAAVVNGRTMLVDCFPYYQNLLPYLLEPVFDVVDFSWTTYTAAMVGLACVGLLLQFAVFQWVTRSWAAALMMFVPYVGFSAYFGLPGGYFQVSPLRYFGPWVLTFVVAWYLSRPSMGRMLALFSVAGLVAVNNLDFGLPAFGAALMAVMFTGRGTILPELGHVAKTAAVAACGGVAALGSFTAFTLARSGQLPQFDKMLTIQKTFGVYGFELLPMPVLGLHWIIYLTWMAATVVALFQLAANGATEVSPDGAGGNLSPGLIVFSAVFGVGTLIYFGGRSYPTTLSATFPAWCFTILLLLWAQLQSARLQRFDRIDAFEMTRWLPAGFLIALYALMAAFVFRTGGEARSDSPAPKPDEVVYDVWSGRVREFCSPGEKVFLALPFGHQIAIENGLDDRFPFAFSDAIALRSQVEMTIDALQKTGVEKVIGRMPEELQLRLYDLGFSVVADDPQNSVSVWMKTGNVDDAAANHRKAALLAAIDRWPEAEAHFHRAIAMDPTRADFRIDYGIALAAHHRPDEAERQYRQAILLAPGNAYAHLSLAQLLQWRGDIAGGIDQATQAVRLAPQSSDAFYTLGVLLIQAGRRDDGVAMLRHALELSPNSAHVIEALHVAESGATPAE